MRRFAISDIHGCLATFNALLDRLGLTTADELLLLGDYIDRGPDSRGVIERIWQLRDQGYHVRCLMGNHELFMILADKEPELIESWLSNGGWATLRSFNGLVARDIPAEYILWAASLPLYLEIDNFILVHAGLNFTNADPFEDEESMLWSRRWYPAINYEWLGDRFILHGHTPAGRDSIESQLQQFERFRVLNIDCGCVFKNRHPGKFGFLCAFDMTNRQLIFQENIEDTQGMA